MSDNPLATYTMDELWDEIRSRVDSAVLITDRKHKTDDDANVIDRRWSGGKVAALGLLNVMRANIEKSFNDDAQEVDD